MEWISVYDRLPLRQEDVKKYDSIDVIVRTKLNEVIVANFAMGNTVGTWHQFGDYEDGYITHWMPLPDPPAKP
jgi:hypothetical protein